MALVTTRSNDGMGHFTVTHHNPDNGRTVTLSDTSDWRGMKVTYQSEGKPAISTVMIDSTRAIGDANMWVLCVKGGPHWCE